MLGYSFQQSQGTADATLPAKPISASPGFPCNLLHYQAGCEREHGSVHERVKRITHER